MLSNIFKIVSFLFILISLLFPTFAKAKISPSFDCKKASTEVEKLICSNEELAKLDVEMNKSYKAFMDSLEESNLKKAVKVRQRKWLNELSKFSCPGNKTKLKCAVTKYKDMIGLLQPISQEEKSIRKEILKESYIDCDNPADSLFIKKQGKQFDTDIEYAENTCLDFLTKTYNFKSGFNCDEIDSSVEKLVCYTPWLSKMNNDMIKLYSLISNEAKKAKFIDFSKKGQKEWLKEIAKDCNFSDIRELPSNTRELRLCLLEKFRDRYNKASEFARKLQYNESISEKSRRDIELYIKGIKAKDYPKDVKLDFKGRECYSSYPYYGRATFPNSCFPAYYEVAMSKNDKLCNEVVRALHDGSIIDDDDNDKYLEYRLYSDPIFVRWFIDNDEIIKTNGVKNHIVLRTGENIKKYSYKEKKPIFYNCYTENHVSNCLRSNVPILNDGNLFELKRIGNKHGQIYRIEVLNNKKISKISRRDKFHASMSTLYTPDDASFNVRNNVKNSFPDLPKSLWKDKQWYRKYLSSGGEYEIIKYNDTYYYFERDDEGGVATLSRIINDDEGFRASDVCYFSHINAPARKYTKEELKKYNKSISGIEIED